jgi:hypothetical protein
LALGSRRIDFPQEQDMDIEKPPPLRETATRFARGDQPLRQLGGGL